MALSIETRQRVQALWDDLAAFGAAGVEEALQHALAELADLLDAQQAYWLGTVRLATEKPDPVAGWRPRAIRYLRPGREAVYLAQRRGIESGYPDSSLPVRLRDAGRFRVLIHHEIAQPEWYDSELYRAHYEPMGLQDMIQVATPEGPDVESWLAFDRIRNPRRAHFGEADRELLDYAVRPLKWFHQQILLHRGIVLATEPLKPSERRVLSSLQSDKTEREIAAELGLTPATVHTYATRIFRKFNVKGRAGLNALWLGRMPAE